ncbi:Hypothetical_protein [Hexamita inflata]|uniref:Hypothetical_protein n=1 Tax=Hexamita inflata TaxID=28002 RepID=A0AA86RRA8_9EUKA|nr:Hypothetical protein HINF_LOCUS64254 [Hexamita inflata]
MDQPPVKVGTMFDYNSIYVGEVQNNAKNGLGIQIFHDGTIYTGTFANNVFEGNGAILQNKKQEIGRFIQGTVYQLDKDKKPLSTEKQNKWRNEFHEYINNDNVSEFKQKFNNNSRILFSCLYQQQQKQQLETHQLQFKSTNDINIKEQINENITILQQQRDQATQNCIDYENKVIEMLENEKWYNTTIEQLIDKFEQLKIENEQIKEEFRQLKAEQSKNIKTFKNLNNSHNVNTQPELQSEDSKCNNIQPAGWCNIKYPNGNNLKGQLNNNILTDLRLIFANRDGLKLNITASINLNNDFLDKINNEELQMILLTEEEQKTAMKLLHKNQVNENICEISFPKGNILRGEIENQKVKNAVLTFKNGDVIPIIGEISIEQDLIQRVNINSYLDVALIKDEIEKDNEIKYIIYKDQNGEAVNEQQPKSQTNENKQVDQIDQKPEILDQIIENANNTCLIAFSNGKSIKGQHQQNCIVNPTITSENGEQIPLQQSIEIQSELFNLLNQNDILDLSKLSEEQKFKVQNDNIDCSVVFPNGNTLSGKLRQCFFENPVLTFKNNQVIFINENVKILNETVLKLVKSEQLEENQLPNNNHTQQQDHEDNQQQLLKEPYLAPKVEDNSTKYNQINLDSNQFIRQQNNTQNAINIGPNTNGPIQNKTGVGTENDQTTNDENQNQTQEEDESQNQNEVKISNEQNQTNEDQQGQNDEQTTQNDNSGTKPTVSEPDALQSSNTEKAKIGSENTNQKIVNGGQTNKPNNSDVTAQNNQNITDYEIDEKSNSIAIDSASEKPTTNSQSDHSQMKTLKNVNIQHLEGQKDNSTLILNEEPREQNPTNPIIVSEENGLTKSNQVPQQMAEQISSGTGTQKVNDSQNVDSEETGEQNQESSSESIVISSDSEEENKSQTNKEQQNENKVEEEKEAEENNEEQQDGNKEDEDKKEDSSKQQDANINQSKVEDQIDKNGKVGEVNVNANMTQAGNKDENQNIQNTEKIDENKEQQVPQLHNIVENTNAKLETNIIESTDNSQVVGNQNPANEEEINSSDIDMGESSEEK